MSRLAFLLLASQALMHASALRGDVFPKIARSSDAPDSAKEAGNTKAMEMLATLVEHADELKIISDKSGDLHVMKAMKDRSLIQGTSHKADAESETHRQNDFASRATMWY
mmetsp:Transcript_6963/g.19206  ORF Transcript_6963/g.19206 Transcript_6963/m.19206 type:complete len:110 (-) Transcript_6963:54-383(-)